MSSDVAELARRCEAVRGHVVEMCAGPEGGHLGGSMSLVEILVALYFDVLRGDPAAQRSAERDVLLLSKGHGAIGLYAALAERGVLPMAAVAEYGTPGSLLMGHPIQAVPGVELPTGSLGHGLALANGFCLTAKHRGEPRRCFVIMGDGELQEGSVWEAAMAASSFGLDNLVAIIDRNTLQITGRTEDTIGLEPLGDRWAAFGWAVREVDGHDLGALRDALTDVPAEAGRPTVVIARTVKGQGLPFAEDKRESHYAKLGPRTLRKARAVLAANSADAGNAADAGNSAGTEPA